MSREQQDEIIRITTTILNKVDRMSDQTNALSQTLDAIQSDVAQIRADVDTVSGSLSTVATNQAALVDQLKNLQASPTTDPAVLSDLVAKSQAILADLNAAVAVADTVSAAASALAAPPPTA